MATPWGAPIPSKKEICLYKYWSNNQVKHVNEQFPTLSSFLGQHNQVKHVNEQFPT